MTKGQTRQPKTMLGYREISSGLPEYPHTVTLKNREHILGYDSASQRASISITLEHALDITIRFTEVNDVNVKYTSHQTATDILCKAER